MAKLLPRVSLLTAMAFAVTLGATEPNGSLIVVGVPASLAPEVSATAARVLEGVPGNHRVLPSEELTRDPSAPLRAGRLVALGADACRRLVAFERPLTCALLSAEAFADIRCEKCGQLRAVVMDQPVARRISVATAIYPSLRRFGVLSANGAPAASERPFGTSVAYRPFHPDLPLATQVQSTLGISDALLALPEPGIVDRDTLRVVLLTAYGYAKPVIGFGREQVRAGALLSVYSTIEQVLSEVLVADDADAEGPGIEDTGGDARMRPPSRYSIAENRSIARSLGLVRRFDADPGRTYTDADFRS